MASGNPVEIPLSFLGAVNIAVRLVREQFPDAQLFVVEASPPTPEYVTNPTALTHLSLVFDIKSGTAFISSTDVWGEFGPVTHKPDKWTGVEIIHLPIAMEAVKADELLKKAGYTDSYSGFSLAQPLYPGCNEPYYMFNLKSGQCIYVGTKSKKVFPGQVRRYTAEIRTLVNIVADRPISGKKVRGYGKAVNELKSPSRGSIHDRLAISLWFMD
jgi:hypothetical protein